MSWTRRDFLASSTAAVAASVIGRRSVVGAYLSPAAWADAEQPAPLNPVFTPLRRNIGFFTCRGGTIGYLINSAGVAVVDSQYPDSALLCLDGLRERSGGRRIDCLINTHHHADHTGGNVAFRAQTKQIVAHTSVPALQRQANEQATAPVEQVYADTTVVTTWKTSVGDETIGAAYYAPAHTGGDLVVHFEQANIVHVGDLVFNRLQAFVDRPGGASAVHWITMVEQIAKTYPADATYLWGHAGAKFPVSGSRADLLVMRDYLTALVGFVRSQVQAGKPRNEIIAMRDVLNGFEDHGPLTARALTGTYDELAGS